jgi:hypothetical protein
MNMPMRSTTRDRHAVEGIAGAPAVAAAGAVVMVGGAFLGQQEKRTTGECESHGVARSGSTRDFSSAMIAGRCC